jgi:hypothetical protein
MLYCRECAALHNSDDGRAWKETSRETSGKRTPRNYKARERDNDLSVLPVTFNAIQLQRYQVKQAQLRTGKRILPVIMDVLKAVQTYLFKLLNEAPGMKVLLLDAHTVSHPARLPSDTADTCRLQLSLLLSHRLSFSPTKSTLQTVSISRSGHDCG